jgi:hypothetical protein
VKAKQIDEAKRLLAEAGFKIEIGGCGCCGSPWVKLSHQGKLIIADENGHAVDNGEIDMFGEASE